MTLSERPLAHQCGNGHTRREETIRRAGRLTLFLGVSALALTAAGALSADEKATAPAASALAADNASTSGQLAETEQPQSFTIPAGSLQSALLAFSKQVNLQLLYAADLTSGIRSQGVDGTYTPVQALRLLLADTGLQFTVTDANTVTLKKTGGLAGDGQVEMGPIMVQETGMTGGAWDYRPQVSGVGTKLPLPPRQTPFTVNQVGAEQMQDRGDATVYDALENFAGVTHQSTNSDTGSNFARGIFVRGFNIASDGAVLVNGQRFYTTGTNFRSTASMERVELLRGAAGIYYGASQPGGVINYVFKQPLDTPMQKLTAGTDSHLGYGTTIDVTGPIGTAKQFSYRIIADYSREQDDVDEIHEEPKSLMTAVKWEPNPQFNSTLTMEALKIDGVPQRYDNIRVNGELFDAPDDMFWGHDDDFVDVFQYTGLLENQWTPADDLNLRTYLAYQFTMQDHQTTRIGGRGGGSPDGNGALPRTVHVGESEEKSLSAGFDLSGTSDFGAFTHDWLVGYGFAYGEGVNGVAQCSTGAGTTNDCYPIRPTAQHPYTPSHYAYPYTDEIFALIGTQRGGRTHSESTDHNAYVQDLMTLPNEATKIMIGMGYTYSQQVSRTVPKGEQPTGPDESLSATRLTPRLALIHDLDDLSTVYASYNESYLPQLYSNPDGTTLEQPEMGVQYEIGYKRDMFDGKALFTAALFRLDKENVQRNDPRYDPDDGYKIADGLQRSQGLELELSGRITNWWKAHLAYAYLDTEVVESDSNQGDEFEYISRHNLTLWNKVRLFGSPSIGEFSLGAGMSLFSKAQSYSSTNNSGYYLVDVGLFYERAIENGPLVQAALRVDNLFDRDYFDRRSFGSSVTYGDERTISFSLGATF